jgi:sulfofructosephosphate aldolase
VVSLAQRTEAVATLDAIARPSGTFLMVAMDQRESLRTMIAEQAGGPVADERLVAFKLAVARELASLASGFLIDRHYGFDEVVRQGLLPPSCGLILAADTLVHVPGEPVEDTELDVGVDAAAARTAGAVALKLLVVWRDDERRAHRAETARRFVDLARSHGMLSVLEPVVRGGPGFDREAAILEAATELGRVGCDLYKCEVPTHGKGEPEEVTDWCRRIDAVLPCPWVVLSQGVDHQRFPAAVEAACRGGASGMLAGRAIWSDVAGADDPGPLLRERAGPRLRRLAEIVDAHGVPWHERGGAAG